MLELDLVSHNGSFATLDIISSGLDRFRPPRRMNPTHGFRIGESSGGMGTHEIARPKSSPPPATRHACVHYKKKKIAKNQKKQVSAERWAPMGSG